MSAGKPNGQDPSVQAVGRPNGATGNGASAGNGASDVTSASLALAGDSGATAVQPDALKVSKTRRNKPTSASRLPASKNGASAASSSTSGATKEDKRSLRSQDRDTGGRRQLIFDFDNTNYSKFQAGTKEYYGVNG